MLQAEQSARLDLTEQTRERNYGIDLLRLVSMLMVVILHVLGRGGVLRSAGNLTFKGESFWALEIMCYCAVNVFAIISGYVGLKARHKYHGLISICLELLLYSFVITGVELSVAFYRGTQISVGRIISHLFPSMRGMWYFSAYFCLFFFMPALNSIVESMPRNSLKKIGVFVFAIFCCWTQLTSRVSNLAGGYSVFWLAILYVLGAYMAKYEFMKKVSISKSAVGYFACVLLSILCRIVMGNIYSSRINLLVSYTSPTIVLSALFLVNIFSKIKMGEASKKLISFLAPMAFGVYLIHCHPYIYDSMDNAFSWIAAMPVCFAIPVVLGVSTTIFMGCLIGVWLKTLLFKAFRIRSFAVWIEDVLGKVFARTLSVLHISFDD